MENQLRCVMFNREEFLIEHQLDADVLFLLEGLYQYGVRVLNLDGKTTKEDMEEKLLQAGYRTEETLLIAAEDATLQNGREIGLATIAFVNQEKNGQTYSAADIVVEGFEEVDFYFLERIYQRKHGIPWRVIETERTYLREMTVEDVEALYEIYAQEGMTDFIEPLCEKREDEIAYTKAYIENMYVYYGYGMWLVCDRENGEIIGRAGLNTQEIEDEIVLEMGYLIRQEYQRLYGNYGLCKRGKWFFGIELFSRGRKSSVLRVVAKIGIFFSKRGGYPRKTDEKVCLCTIDIAFLSFFYYNLFYV